MRYLWLGLLLLALPKQAGAQAVQAQAEDGSLPSDIELSAILQSADTTADEAYELGLRFFGAKRYESAESAWLRALALGRDPTLLIAVADVRERRGDEPGAVVMLEQYLVDRPDAPDRPSIEARIATLLQSPAVLRIRSEQPGHAILLDGVPVGKKTPADLEVAPGSHEVIVVGEGKQIGEKTVQVGYGELKELDFTPETKSSVPLEQGPDPSVQSQLAVDKEDITVRRAVISTGSIAAASLLAGTVLGALAIRRNKSSDGTDDQTDGLTISAEVSLGLAALTAITSFTLFMTHKKQRRRERETARLRIETRGAGAAATFRF
ncbi:MAG: PEGA domain-containing protein [Polyangiales bacterium]